MIATLNEMPKLERLAISMLARRVRPSFLYGLAQHGPGGRPFLTLTELALGVKD